MSENLRCVRVPREHLASCVGVEWDELVTLGINRERGFSLEHVPLSARVPDGFADLREGRRAARFMPASGHFARKAGSKTLAWHAAAARG